MVAHGSEVDAREGRHALGEAHADERRIEALLGARQARGSGQLAQHLALGPGLKDRLDDRPLSE